MKKDNDVKEVINTKKMVLEIIAIPLCVLYLYYILLFNHPKISLAFLSIITIVTCIEFIVLYINNVYVYENKYNFLRVILTIVYFAEILLVILNVFVKGAIVRYLFLICSIILLINLFCFAIFNIFKVIRKKGFLFKNAFAAFFSLISFFLIIMGLVIMMF